ncbi:ATP-dependent DNA helicase RecG [Cellulomonas taurus]|uniref:ATP-dependent DNA helicase RecG n=1 Tax=Cellulomonas taurus TaxID=2729175 RepID=UPI00145F0177|nr:ATP-dependent DNA helicase RecG [Cellulomonas taurus]
MTGLEDAVVRPGPLLGQQIGTVLGATTGARLAKLDLHTVGELLRHYPRRYARLGEMTDLASLTPKEHATVMARVAQATVRTTRTGGAMMNVEITDGRSTLGLVFFAKHKGALRFHEGRLKPGVEGLFSGEVGTDKLNGRPQLAHPSYRLFGIDVEDEAAAVEEAKRPIPLYPASAQVPTEQIQKAVGAIFPLLTPADVPDPLPAELLTRRKLPELLGALRRLHQPENDEEIRSAQERLKFEEAFVLQAELARRRSRIAREGAVARPPRDGGIRAAFDERLPFTLTEGQLRVGAELSAELAGERPMQRLLQGEVGSGKTVVALRAMLQVVDAGGQAALLAPTEVLAAQHERTLRRMLGELAEAGMLGGADDATRVTLLTGSQSTAVRRQALAEAASGAAGIVVGTHALLSEHVQFADLGLVVVDEQHRFGVEQRDLLRAKARTTPHLLVMTATPIPRTVAMTVFGDLETSILDQVPAGRAEVVTHVVPAGNDRWMQRTWQRVREEVDKGGRAYVVCARIDPDAKDGADGADGAELVPDEGPAKRPLRAVMEVAEQLAASPELGGLPVGVLHGRMTPEEKERALADFADGTVPVLVSTTVVEVGVDVPDATVMVVLDADRFGVSQLHQLRGRIGRGTRPGVCLLVADAFPGSPADTRLRSLAETRDGFQLAAVDLELRREGDVLGAAQSGGATSLRLLRVTRDADVIEEARIEARSVVRDDPDLDRHPDLRTAIDLLLDGEREEYLDRT